MLRGNWSSTITSASEPSADASQPASSPREAARPRAQAEHQQGAADQRADAAGPRHRVDPRGGAVERRKIQPFLRAVLHEDQRADDAQHAQDAWRPYGFEGLQHGPASLFEE